ncbi:hypothetical protein X739_29200 [Mesorhizobium sp. LNHC220B00]|nr:hypothetical protein X739_29200 [Mesorhizobium sp. LNHC220B00]
MWTGISKRPLLTSALYLVRQTSTDFLRADKKGARREGDFRPEPEIAKLQAQLEQQLARLKDAEKLAIKLKTILLASNESTSRTKQSRS